MLQSSPQDVISVQGIFFYMKRLIQPKFSLLTRAAGALAAVLLLLAISTPSAALAAPMPDLFARLLAAIASSTPNPDIANTAYSSTDTAAASQRVTIPEAFDPFSLTNSGNDEIDERAARLDAYFTKKNMPLAGYGSTFVQAADQCGMDWQLLPAIAVRESSGGKRMRLNNPFGWASAKIGFSDLNESIMQVGKHLCGLMPSTSRYYKDTTTSQKLYHYNGTVSPSYPREVLAIMDMF